MIMKLRWFAVIALCGTLLIASQANAVFIPLGPPEGAEVGSICFSGELSDDDAPLDYFHANFEYWYDPDFGIFGLTVNNLTDPGYTISEVFINVSNDVALLTLIYDDGFYHASLNANSHAGGFGTFDYELDLGRGNRGLSSGDSATFLFYVTSLVGTDQLTLADFFSGLSWGGGLTPAEAAIKFTQGPCDDSVYAIPCQPQVVPEPATNTLLGLGIVGMLMRKLRKA
ncbi:MAG TPA: PEP-CTERM sorting domain-containing protein [Candidatus Hydrogenedentes bacterium]|nr:PEP-CTERM sorting domain-containing protein [Candidatus Hydrogenedentota bacterium]HOL78331.1 PEP-CTERM sorting domain-containing protein [Candidatus Hydrogenedentota bacterium]HPO86308.1 PEP-CTERM sorting domain-containing protein [Candidatus Hydrogenedentota bacterium]